MRLLAPVAAILALLAGAVIAAALTMPGARAPAEPSRWARPAADRLAGAGLWPELAGADLGRDATRADLDRAVGILTGVPTASPDPAAPAGAWVVNRLLVAAVGLEPERLGLQALATDDGRRLPLPPNFGSEILARELGLVRNHRRDELERSRGEPVRLGNLAAMVDRARAITDEDRLRLARFRDIRLPSMSGARLAVVRAALSQVGQPYVWGGEWPSPASPRGPQAHGGFDCSGLAWWAFTAGRVAPRGGARGGPARPDHGGRHGLGAAPRAAADRRARARRPRVLRRPRAPVAARDHLPQRDRPRQRLDGPRLGLARGRLGEPSGGLLARGPGLRPAGGGAGPRVRGGNSRAGCGVLCWQVHHHQEELP